MHHRVLPKQTQGVLLVGTVAQTESMKHVDGQAHGPLDVMLNATCHQKQGTRHTVVLLSTQKRYRMHVPRDLQLGMHLQLIQASVQDVALLHTGVKSMRAEQPCAPARGVRRVSKSLWTPCAKHQVVRIARRARSCGRLATSSPSALRTKSWASHRAHSKEATRIRLWSKR